MVRARRLVVLAAGMTMLLPSVGPAQDAASASLTPRLAGWASAPSGSGPWPAVAEVRSDLSGYTVYRPAKLPGAPLPLVIWGNGACKDNGLAHAQFLREVASHGFYVIALGAARAERAVDPSARMPANPGPPARVDETQTAQMIAAIDWAARPPADLAGHIDASRIAAMGHSCGGLQAIAASADPRITTTLIFNSGVYNRPVAANRSNVAVSKADLARLHGPIAYFIGGPTDIAYENAMDDVARLKDDHSVFLGQLPIGHLGTFWVDANGGEWARAASAWLNWQLKGDAASARLFVGTDCGLCRAGGWQIDNSGLRPRHQP